MARYARTVGGNWTDNATWSTTSGGAADTVAPTASDDVFLDANSGNVTISATSVGKSLTCTGYTGTLTHNTGTTLTISGSVTLVSGMTYTPASNSSVLAMGASGTLTTGGKILQSLTISSGTTTFGDNIELTGNFTNSSSVTHNNKTLTFSGASTQAFSGGGTYYGIVRTATATKTCAITFSAAITVTNTLTLNGNSATNRLLVASNTLGTQRIITTTGATVTSDNADYRDIQFSVAKDLSAGLVGDCGGNTNITFTTAADQHWVSASGGNWSTSANWTSRVPLPQDNVYFDNAFSASQTVTADMPRLGKSIDWTGASGSPTFTNSSVATTFYGSWTMITGMSVSSWSASLTAESRTTAMLTSGGKTFPSFTWQGVGGTLTLGDSLTSSSSVSIQNGTFNTGGFGVSATTYSIGSNGTSNFSSSTITATSTGTVFNIGSHTINSGTSTLVISDISASSKTFAGNGKTFYNLQITGGGAGAVIITGANTFNRIYTDGGGTKTITFPASATTTLTYTGTDNFGNGNNLLTIASSSGGSAFTISKPVGRFEADYLNLTDSTATGTFYAGEHSVNVSGNSGWIFSSFTPNQSGNLMAWLDALDGGDGTFTDRLTKTAYTATSVTRGANVNEGTEMIFNGTSSKIQMGNIGEIYSLTFWVKPGTNACSLIDFNGTEYISTVSGTVTATSWTSPTIYVNGVVTSILPTNVWSHVAVTSTTSVTASAVVLGLIGSTYGDCSLTNIKMYDRVLSATDIGRQIPSFPSANRALLQNLVNYTGLTFYKNYGLPNINTVNADYASGSATGTWTVTRSSSTPATYCDSDGTIQLVTGTNPRFTQGFYDSTGFVSRPGLIVEGASTNLAKQTSDLSTTWTLSPNTSVGVGITTPDGVSGGNNLITTTNASNGIYQGSITVSASTTYTWSWFSYAGTMATPKYAIYDETGLAFIASDVSYTAGSGEWVRHSVTFTTPVGCVSLRIYPLRSGSIGTIYIWGNQVEALPFASTFIPTTTAALTRNAETLTYPISGNRTAANETFFVKFTTYWSVSAVNGYTYELLSTDTVNRSLEKHASNNYWTQWANRTDNNILSIGSTSYAPTAFTSYVLAYALDNDANPSKTQIGYMNGSELSSSTTNWTAPAWGTNFYVGCNNASTAQLNGIIQSLAIFSDSKSASNVLSISNLLSAS